MSGLQLIVVDDGSTDRTAEIVWSTPGAPLVLALRVTLAMDSIPSIFPPSEIRMGLAKLIKTPPQSTQSALRKSLRQSVKSVKGL